MTWIYVLLAISILLAAVSAVLCFMLFKRRDRAPEDRTDELKKDLQTTVKIENSMLTGAVNAQIQATKDLTVRFDNFMSSVDGKLDRMREENAKNLGEVRSDNARALTEVRAENAKSIAELRADNALQLEKMRETVDEKLSSTLERRFNQSFRIVGERLEQINKSFADLQNLQTGVNDLKSIFKNVKTRGTWGEVALENLLLQILTEEQFERSVNISKNENERVDFVIKLPGKGDGEVYLPIDAKFPIEDYQRLVECSEKADAEGVESAGKAIERRIKAEAQSIRDKYIRPPKTTDFAIMYLPIEGLFAEVIKRNGLIEDLQNRCRIVVCGPTTLAALLNSLQMGFRSVAIEKRSTEIGKLLRTFVGDFDKFSSLLQQTGKKLESVQSTIASANSRTEIIRKKLGKVGRFTDPLPGGQAPGEENGLLPEDSLRDVFASETAADIDAED